MGDRTYGKMEVLACPPEHVGAVLDLINEYGLLRHTDSSLGRPEDELVLGEDYTYEEMRCGAVADMASALRNFDGVACMVSEDPKYKWLGDVFYRLADGRTLHAEADATQNILLTESQYRSLRSEEGGLAAVDRHFDLCLVDEYRAVRRAIANLPVPERTLRKVPVPNDGPANDVPRHLIEQWREEANQKITTRDAGSHVFVLVEGCELARFSTWAALVTKDDALAAASEYAKRARLAYVELALGWPAPIEDPETRSD
jgi:hypothetical protein